MLLLASSTAFGVDYGQLMAAKVKAALGDNATKGYKFATYPVDNFGLATAYESKVDINKQICVTWDCLGISDDSKVDAFSAINKLRLVANGTQYANVGAGEGLSLTEDEKKALGIKALLPKILQALSLSFDLSQAKNVSTELTTGPVTIRTLRRLEMQKHIQSSDGHQLEKEAFSAGNLVLVYSDIVVSTLKISLKVNAQTDADLEAKLSDALKGKVGKVIGSGSSVGFKVNKATTGDYAFQITRPLIVAVYTKKQPHSQHLGTQGGWKSWTDADMSDANKITAENIDLGEIH
jgi:hypothetical protein